MITIVAAIARGGAVGRAGKLPWHYPEDLAHFKALTMGHAVVMGRKTWESLPVKVQPLPGRENAVLSRSGARAPGAIVYPDLDAALWGLCDVQGHDRIDVIGGAEVYAAALPVADRLEITEVDVEVPDADAFFPFQAFGRAEHVREPSPDRMVAGPFGVFRETARRRGDSPGLTFVTWERVR
jgi:dihydrofolate reductase